MKYYLGVDLGGTNIAVGVMDESYRIIARSGRKTRAPRPASEICDEMAEAIRDAVKAADMQLSDFERVGIAAPGTIDNVHGVIGHANNFGYHDVPMAEMMRERLDGLEVRLENDANAAALAEALVGAAKGHRHVVMITLGTGIGGGIIIDGKIYGGHCNMAGELGHMGINFEGVECSCGKIGCAERYASAAALTRQTREAMQAHPESVMWELTEGQLEKANGRTPFEAMRRGDETGRQVVEQYIAYLSYVLHNYAVIFSPEVLVIGGGISKEGPAFLEMIREALHTDVPYKQIKSQLELATLGNDAGIIGAALL